MGPGLLEGSKRDAWISACTADSALASEERWLGGTSIDSEDWLSDIHA